MPPCILFLSASMGAGHDVAARELARRVEAQGARTVVIDFLEAFPYPMGSLWRSSYFFQLRRMPESYEDTYQLFYRFPRSWGAFIRLERALAGRRTLAWVEAHRPDVIVSTYSFATLALGRLREEGRITVPVVNFLIDFVVHPRTVHPAVDLNLAIHPLAAEAARGHVPGPVVVAGPAVDPSFSAARPPGDREATRSRLGGQDGRPLVLVVAGSSGVGRIEETVEALVAPGRFDVVTACGRDEHLRRRLQQRGLGTALAWTDRMAEIMAAADVVVENAGGLTAQEAFASGVPVVSYRPIPGHGRDSVAVMCGAGLTTVPRDSDELVEAVDRLSRPGPAREAQLTSASVLFGADPVRYILEAAGVAAPAQPAQSP